MPTYHTTADWVVAQLRKEDWVTRNMVADRLKISRPRVYEGIVKRMGPCELLAGECTGPAMGRTTIIISKGSTKAKYKQTTLYEYFHPKVSKDKQRKLTEFFIIVR